MPDTEQPPATISLEQQRGAALARAPGATLARQPGDFLAIERTHTLDDARAEQMGVADVALREKPATNPLTARIYTAAHRMMDRITDASDMDGRGFVMVALPARFADYLTQRAAAHGETPERHAESIIRRFWQNDEWRTAQTSTAPRQPGDPAGTERKR